MSQFSLPDLLVRVSGQGLEDQRTIWPKKSVYILAEKTPKNDLFSNTHLLVWYELGSQIFFLNESLLLELQFAHKHLYVVRVCFPQKNF